MDTQSPALSAHRPVQRFGNRKTVAAIAFLVSLAAPALLLVEMQRAVPSRGIHAGDSIPAAELGSNDPGRALLERINEKAAAILFFSTDCPHCQWEIPIFNEAWKRFGGDVEFVAMALNSAEKVLSFVRANDIRVKIIVDEEGITKRSFGVSELPSLFLVLPNRRIGWVGSGELPRSEVFRRCSILIGANVSR